VPVLVDHDDSQLVVQRDDRNGAGVLHHLARRGVPRRHHHLVDAQRRNPPDVPRLTASDREVVPRARLRPAPGLG